jgi:formate-dependent phosphoribosylglycinamide formyltransferase (GAR transformylase)
MSNQKKALLVGSSFSAAPIFFALKNYGLHVSVCGNLKTDPCHQYADASFFIDYSKPEELMRVVESEKFDFLVPTCNDYSYLSCATVAETHGFFGFDRTNVATILHTKSEFREVTEKHLLPVPRFIRQMKGLPIETGALRFPLLVKPIDSFSGRGMTKVSSDVELSVAVRNAIQASCSGEVVLEEFVEGSLHSHSAFIENKTVALDFFVDEFCTVYPYQVNCSNHPSVVQDDMRTAVRNTINQLATILNLGDGLLHTQFIVNGDEFWIIECMRRCPGDLYGSMVEQSTGINYADLFTRPFLNMQLPIDLRELAPKHVGRHTISTQTPLVNFSFSHNIPATTVDIVPLKSSGEKLAAAPFDKLAIFFAEFSNHETMIDVTQNLADFVRIRTLGDKR